MNLAFDQAGNLLVLSSAGPEGTVYSFRPGSPKDQITVLAAAAVADRIRVRGSILPVELLEQRRIQKSTGLRHSTSTKRWRRCSRRTCHTPKAKEYVSPDGSVFLPAGRVFQQGRADSTAGWRFSDNLDTYGFISALPGDHIYVSSESEDITYRALVNADGTLGDLQPFAHRGGESVAVDSKGNVYVANGQIFVYDRAGKPDRADRRAGTSHRYRFRRRRRAHPVHPCPPCALRRKGPYLIDCRKPARNPR